LAQHDNFVRQNELTALIRCPLSGEIVGPGPEKVTFLFAFKVDTTIASGHCASPAADEHPYFVGFS
jgi:hypothetical protein